MDNILTLQEMSDRYNGEWLLIAYTELDENMIVVRGEVLAHSPNQSDVYDALPIAKGRNVAFEYIASRNGNRSSVGWEYPMCSTN